MVIIENEIDDDNEQEMLALKEKIRLLESRIGCDYCGQTFAVGFNHGQVATFDAIGTRSWTRQCPGRVRDIALSLDGAWTAIIVSMVLAYLLSPVVTFFERRLRRIIHSYEVRRTLAVLLTWLAVIGLFALVLGLVVPAPSMTRSISSLSACPSLLTSPYSHVVAPVGADRTP